VILVDTSVWVDHLRSGDNALASLLQSGQVLAHAFVTGEIALGNLRQREKILEALQQLPQINVANDLEVLHFVDTHKLFGIGIGYVDAHLMAAVRLTPGAVLWTRDKRLLEPAKRLGLASPLHA
jgi:predicted nucleic acid-binding protein